MIFRSLRLRLLLVSTASVIAALILANFVLVELFERHVERRVGAELETYLRQLSGFIHFDSQGGITTQGALADPRLVEPLSGLYWQIQDNDTGATLRSRSLWDYVIPLPPLKPGSEVVRGYHRPGPGDTVLIVKERLVTFESLQDLHRLRLVFAIDNKSVTQAGREFASDLFWPFVALAAFLCLAAAVQIWFGLRPLEAVRGAVNAVRTREKNRLPTTFPDEIMPLVAEMNVLLDMQEKIIEQSHHRASDLAHALKTPLTVILSDAKKLRSTGQAEIADELEFLIGQMRRYIERELSRARLAHRTAHQVVSCDAVSSITSVVRALKRTPRGALLQWSLEMPDECPVSMDSGDLSEVLGNILDNAVKWAQARVSVCISRDDNNIVITIMDDGPGAPPEKMSDLGRRGFRMDEKKPGSGMGLAIADDILAVYAGHMSIVNGPMGGLLVNIRLPAA